ncbi:MAG: Panacea domain-containing protein [Pirellulales bacterium]
MSHSARAVANFFLELAKESEVQLSPMKLQKLVFFAHGWHLAILGTPLINEQVEAWEFGPVIPSLYHSFKAFGNQPISEPAHNYRIAGGRLHESTPTIPDTPETGPTRALLRKVWEVYSPFTATQLSNVTHQPGTPWRNVVDDCKARYGLVPKGTDIPTQLIQQYFATL